MTFDICYLFQKNDGQIRSEFDVCLITNKQYVTTKNKIRQTELKEILYKICNEMK